jgi:hypothetical protein
MTYSKPYLWMGKRSHRWEYTVGEINEHCRVSCQDTQGHFMNDRYPTIHPLGDGLILRRSIPADAEALADFCARIHSDQGPEQPMA